MQQQRFHIPKNVIEPYQYDIALNYIEAYRPSTEINNLIETSKEEMYSLIKEAIKNNYTDITFTGGEPLLKLDDIIWYLNKLSEYLPDLDKSS